MKMRLSSTILGVFMAGAILAVAITSTSEHRAIYMNALGLLLVFGGTTAAFVLTYGLGELPTVTRAIARVFFPERTTLPAAVDEVLRLAAGARIDRDFLSSELERIRDGFTREAVSLIVHGLPLAEARSILKHTMASMHEHELDAATSLRVISRFPPAFGMMGTLVGLIAMLQGVGGGHGVRELGPAMSVALVATFYGIVFTNMVLLPLAEAIEKGAARSARRRELTASGVLMIQEKVPVVLIRERLRAYLTVSERKKLGAVPMVFRSEPNTAESEPVLIALSKKAARTGAEARRPS